MSKDLNNLHKFLNAEDSAMILMGLSMAKGIKISTKLLPKILALYLWNEDKNVRANAKIIFNRYANDEAKSIVKQNWKSTLRTIKVPKYYNLIKSLRDKGKIDLIKDYNEKILIVIEEMKRGNILEDVLELIDSIDDKSLLFLPLAERLKDFNRYERKIVTKFQSWPTPDLETIKKLARLLISSDDVVRRHASDLMEKYGQQEIVEILDDLTVTRYFVQPSYEWYNLAAPAEPTKYGPLIHMQYGPEHPYYADANNLWKKALDKIDKIIELDTSGMRMHNLRRLSTISDQDSSQVQKSEITEIDNLTSAFNLITESKISKGNIFFGDISKDLAIECLKIIFNILRVKGKKGYKMESDDLNIEFNKAMPESNEDKKNHVYKQILSYRFNADLLHIEVREYFARIPDLKTKLKGLGVKPQGTKNKLFDQLIEVTIN
jgi:hypothetical protein